MIYYNLSVCFYVLNTIFFLNKNLEVRSTKARLEAHCAVSKGATRHAFFEFYTRV